MKNILFAALLFLCSCGNNNADTTTATPGGNDAGIDGEQLFQVNCAQCHLPGKNFVGPALAGVEQRWNNNQLLYDFVRNSAEVIKRDKYAAELYAKWNESAMLPFPHLSDKEIAAILDYCNAEAAKQ